MNRYETLFIIKPDQSDDEIQAVIDRLCERIEKANGKVAAINYWGARRLADVVRYRSERLMRGYYILLTYLGDGTVVDEVERNIKILDASFRYFSLKLADNVDPESVTEVQITRPNHGPTPPEPTKTEEAPESEGGPEDAAPAEESLESAESSEPAES